MKNIFSLLFIVTLIFNSCAEEEKPEATEKSDNNAPLTACDCAKMKENEAPDECFELRKSWEKEFELSDATRKEEMTKEIIDCMNKK
ncbi:MAG: hypothetical protein R2799_12680 [Crocinitomicaceae bacterium]